MKYDIDTEVLKEIGLTEGEIQVYLGLLHLGSSSVGDIAEEVDVSKSKIYPIVDRLEEKGLASHVLKNNVKHFRASPPKQIQDYVEEKKERLNRKERQVESLIPRLNDWQENRDEDIRKTSMYEDYRGIRASMQAFLEDMEEGDSYVVFGSQDKLDDKYKALFRKFHKRRADKGVKVRMLYNSDFKEVKEIYRDIPLLELRFIDDITPNTIAASDEKTHILTYGENPLAVLIQSRQIAESFRNFFESTWQVAEPADL